MIHCRAASSWISYNIRRKVDATRWVIAAVSRLALSLLLTVIPRNKKKNRNYSARFNYLRPREKCLISTILTSAFIIVGGNRELSYSHRTCIAHSLVPLSRHQSLVAITDRLTARIQWTIEAKFVTPSATWCVVTELTSVLSIRRRFGTNSSRASRVHLSHRERRKRSRRISPTRKKLKPTAFLMRAVWIFSLGISFYDRFDRLREDIRPRDEPKPRDDRRDID